MELRFEDQVSVWHGHSLNTRTIRTNLRPQEVSESVDLLKLPRWVSTDTETYFDGFDDWSHFINHTKNYPMWSLGNPALIGSFCCVQNLIDIERQLRCKPFDKKVIGAFENSEFTSPEFMMVVETVLIITGTTIEAKYQRQIDAINTVTAFHGVEEGRSTPCFIQTLRQAAGSIRGWIDQCTLMAQHYITVSTLPWALT
ncbi:hypothetical protein N7493_011767 [Penicillium malachiteum]|uniref:Uncharacterized protein n=1 Tax=Penicillium malachiteum TaxID=1324776 RepID=A0AAD6HAM3_9EURO|nr:hypothetical protein N7493_011767 [Penicillium malachiteum]